jgi:hypothetical protein
MEKPLNRTADFVIEYTLKVGNLWLAVYRSYSCESHASNFGGYIVFNENGSLLHVESGYPGICQNLSTNDILCLNHYMAQGILSTSISHCRIDSKYELLCERIFATGTDIEEKGKIQGSIKDTLNGYIAEIPLGWKARNGEYRLIFSRSKVRMQEAS